MSTESIPSDVTWDTDVNSPPHYNTNGLETIDLIQQSMSNDEFKGYLKGNVLKYVSRYRHKHSSEPKKDLLKAQWYLNKLLKEW
tara:strand:- start:195 stop:446 length:252 start_codon:yes stop_codon:yes gene_type:complete